MKINNIRLEALVSPVCEIAKQAGVEIMKIYQDEFKIEEKSDHSPLTTADLVSHRTISESLQALAPDIPILSEEASAISFSERSAWTSYWLVDPLDGTREFIKRNDEFSVNIALIKNQIVCLGVVYVPAQDVCYFASKGNGAFKREQGQSAVQINTRYSAPDDTPTICGSRSHAGKSMRALLEQIGEYELISIGSSIKICLIAEGIADIYPRFGPTSEWDTAAAQSVVEEAGGSLVDTKLQPLHYNTKDSLLNPSFIAVGDMSNRWRDFLSHQ